MENGLPIYQSFGGGRNSVALSVEFAKRGIIPADIVMADTGGEKPETYEYVELFSSWLVDQGFPAIQMVKRLPTEKAGYKTLEEECLVSGTLPSIAYGFKGCSDKWKIRPQHAFVKQKYGKLSAVKWVIGYHAGENKRAENASKTQHSYELWYPLIEWGLDSEACNKTIKSVGLPLPPKSACFFCPSSKLPELEELKKANPELWKRALHIENNALPNLTSVKGLGRKFPWRDLDVIPQEKRATYEDVPSIPCGCFDGGNEED